MSLTSRLGALSSAALLAAGVTNACGQRERADGRTPTNTEAPIAASVGSSGTGTPASGRSFLLDRTNLGSQFVGSSTCTPCHQAEEAAYAKSHHARALERAATATVPAMFQGSSFTTPLGKATHFASTRSSFTVTSPDSDGKPRAFPILYVAGVAPLQQYVVATERGKLQTLGVSWDARSPDKDGRNWFHVYGPRGIAPSDSLFFTKPAQNWNHVCADCHSTLVERRYSAASDTFDTHWAELAVGCEACHGPGAEHVRAARAGGKAGTAASNDLTVILRHSAPWSPSETGSPVPRPQDGKEVDVCAPCHSRREPLFEGFVAGDPFLDAFEPELLRPGRYHADGQVEGEVYEWGSFLQSKMYASGVRCSDCHEPHSGELYASGDALCVRCHAPDRFEARSHSHHSGRDAPSCMDCHMPRHTFMQIDARRDHSIRIPRPDLSIAFDVPNACGECHAQKGPVWAVEQLERWYPTFRRTKYFAEALARDRKGALDARQALDALARDSTAPAITRATALERLGAWPCERSVDTVRTALASKEPLVAFGAVLGASQWPPDVRVPLLARVVAHPCRLIRVAVGKALAEVPTAQMYPEVRAALERDFAEVEASFAVSASNPESHVEKSAFELERGHVAEAVAELNTALRLAPCLVEARLNLADIARGRGAEDDAEREIVAALECAPTNAFALHALGLWQVRNGQKRQALASLRKAAELAPGEARFSYALAVAMGDAGDLEGAVRTLDAALARHPGDQGLSQALADYKRQLGPAQQREER